jgi:predicted transcriptional regulator
MNAKHGRFVGHSAHFNVNFRTSARTPADRAARYDRQADWELLHGNIANAERLSRMAAEIREGRRHG